MMVTSSDWSEKGELYVKKENIGRKLKDFSQLMVLYLVNKYHLELSIEKVVVDFIVFISLKKR